MPVATAWDFRLTVRCTKFFRSDGSLRSGDTKAAIAANLTFYYMMGHKRLHAVYPSPSDILLQEPKTARIGYLLFIPITMSNETIVLDLLIYI